MKVTIHTNFGPITLELFPDKAPITVENFLQYARSGFYNQTVFHRIHPGFVIEGGSFEVNGISKYPRQMPIQNESNISSLPNAKYTVAMSHLTDMPDSATSDFFINLNDNITLNYSGDSADNSYCVFGKVIEGFDVVDTIGNLKTEARGRNEQYPVEDVIIEKVTIEGEPDNTMENKDNSLNDEQKEANKEITAASADDNEEEDAWPGPIVRLETNKGNIDIVLFPEFAPKTVKNFLRYVNEDFYNGTIFHRVISLFMIQGGGYDVDLNSKPRHDSIPYEGNNGLENQRYTVSMARSQALDSASSEFFINTITNPELDDANRGGEGGYTVFGRVIDGFDVVNTIADSQVAPKGSHQHVPVNPVIIEKAYVLEDNANDSGNA